VFNPRYWEEDPNKVALEGKKALEKVLKKIES